MSLRSLLLSVALLAVSAPGLAGPADDARAARDRGDYALALELLDEVGDRQLALPIRADVLERTGRSDAALDLLRREVRDSGASAAVRTAYGRRLVDRGEWERAVEVLDPVAEGDAAWPPARYWRARAFEMLGRQSRSRLELEDFVRDYNRGRARSPDELLFVALACHRLGLYADANATFREALELDPESQEIRLRWAELFLEKYRPDEAANLLDEVIERNAAHPEALALRAQAELSLTYDLDETRRLAEAALEIQPDAPTALEVLAALAIDDRDYETALEYVNAVLDTRPRRLDALSLLGAIHYLRDDTEAYEAVEARTREAHARPAAFYHVVGEFAVRNFRYAEALDLHQRAIELDAGFSPAFVSLGIGFSRAGDDGRALQFLRRAFDADPFNQQAFNMVELWETTLTQYRYHDDDAVDGLRYRFHRDESPVLERYVPEAIRGAWEEYVRRYGFEPEAPVSIEVFADQATFGIRSVGLPYASQHGICFGHVVTARSPSEGNFNWRQVMEHELSHVFSLQRSNARVPRWFTEGLAEYDTILSREEWRREEDLAIIRALQRDELLGVLDLNRAFVSMDRPEQVLEAYFQASLVVQFIGERWGYESLVAMLDAWADSLSTPDVIARVLDLDVDAFDAAFEDAMRERYAGYLGLFEPAVWWYADAAQYRDAAAARPNDAAAQAERAWAEVAAGDRESAYAAVAEAIELDPRNALAQLLAGHLAFQDGRTDDAAAAYRAVIDAGAQSYTAHASLAQIAVAEGRSADAETHLRRAIELFPFDATLVEGLAALLEERGDGAAALEQRMRYARLDEHDLETPLRLAAHFEQAGRPALARSYAERAANVAPFNTELHVLYGRLAHGARDWEIARREIELALAGGGNRAELLPLLLDVYESLGLESEAETLRRELIE